MSSSITLLWFVNIRNEFSRSVGLAKLFINISFSSSVIAVCLGPGLSVCSVRCVGFHVVFIASIRLFAISRHPFGWVHSAAAISWHCLHVQKLCLWWSGGVCSRRVISCAT